MAEAEWKECFDLFDKDCGGIWQPMLEGAHATCELDVLARCLGFCNVHSRILMVRLQPLGKIVSVACLGVSMQPAVKVPCWTAARGELTL